jgi:Tfp pilus assembly PilM family ATPase
MQDLATQKAPPAESAIAASSSELVRKRFSQAQLNLELGNDYLIWSVAGAKKRTIADGGIVVDSALMQADGPPTAINKIVEQQALGRSRVSLYLSISEAILRTFYVAVVPKNELGHVVFWEAERVFPFKPDAELFAWRIIDSVQWGGSSKYQVQAVAVPPQKLRPTFDYLRRNHLIENVILTASSWESLLNSQGKREAETTNCCAAIVRLLGNRLSVLCMHNGKIEFTREVTVEAIVAESSFEASLSKLSDDAISTDRLHYQSLDISELARTVSVELDYYYGQFSQRSVTRIYLAFPEEIESEAETAIAQLLSVEVDSVLSLSHGSSVESQDNYLFLPTSFPPDKTARNLSLTTREIKQDRIERYRFRVAAGFALVAVLAILTAWWLQSKQLHTVQQYRDNLQQLVDTQVNSPAYRQLIEMRSSGTAWLLQWQQFRHASDVYSSVFKLVSNQIPSHTYLTNMQVTTGHPEGAEKFVDASLNGFVSESAKYPELVLVQFIRDLRASPLIRKVELRGHQRILSSAGVRLNFTLRVETK